MKVRTGYVSNSSSTSFCIVGIVIDEDEFGEKLGFADYWDTEEMEGKFGGDVTVHRGVGDYSCESLIIGKDILCMKDDQTMGEFKKEVLEALKKGGLDLVESDIGIRIDGGYDG